MGDKLLVALGYGLMGLIGLAGLAVLGIYFWGSSYTFDAAGRSEQTKLQAEMPKVKAQVEECTGLKRSAESAERARQNALSQNSGVLPANFARSSVEGTINRYEATKASCEPLVAKYDQDYARLIKLTQDSAFNEKNAFEKWLSRDNKPQVETFQFQMQYKACYVKPCVAPISP